MRCSMTALGLALVALFIAAAAQVSQQQPQPLELSVVAGAPLEVQCPLAVSARAQWTLDGAAPPQDMARGERAGRGGQLVATLGAAAAGAGHQGTYQCGPHSPRIRVVVTAAETAQTTAGSAGVAAGGDEQRADDVLWFEVRSNLSVPCTGAGPGDSVEWRVNDTSVDEVAALKGRVELQDGGRVLKVVPRAREDDWGNWSCSWGQGAGSRAWRVWARPQARLAADSGVVEGQRLKLVCKQLGKPYVPVQWLYRNDSMPENSTLPVQDVLGARASVQLSEQGVVNGELVVEPAARSDAGEYRCQPLAPRAAAAATTLRVKDMYAALWPFLGIVAEVVVLCAVILVYERRRAAPLDDSDTDNHDQKKS